MFRNLSQGQTLDTSGRATRRGCPLVLKLLFAFFFAAPLAAQSPEKANLGTMVLSDSCQLVCLNIERWRKHADLESDNYVYVAESCQSTLGFAPHELTRVIYQVHSNDGELRLGITLQFEADKSLDSFIEVMQGMFELEEVENDYRKQLVDKSQGFLLCVIDSRTVLMASDSLAGSLPGHDPDTPGWRLAAQLDAGRDISVVFNVDEPAQAAAIAEFWRDLLAQFTGHDVEGLPDLFESLRGGVAWVDFAADQPLEVRLRTRTEKAAEKLVDNVDQFEEHADQFIRELDDALDDFPFDELDGGGELSDVIQALVEFMDDAVGRLNFRKEAGQVIVIGSKPDVVSSVLQLAIDTAAAALKVGN